MLLLESYNPTSNPITCIGNTIFIVKECVLTLQGEMIFSLACTNVYYFFI